MTQPVGERVSDRRVHEPAAASPSVVSLALRAVVSAVLMLLPGFFLLWWQHAFTSGATCNIGFQPWCRVGWGLPQVYAVAVACLASVCLHLAAAVRWPRPSARALSVLGLAAAALATALVVLEPVLSGVLPSWWFAS